MTDPGARNRDPADPGTVDPDATGLEGTGAEASGSEASGSEASGSEAADGAAQPAAHRSARSARTPRRSMLLRLDPMVHDALATWAAQDLRSLNAHVEWLLRRALDDAGRLPKHVPPQPPRGRPRGTG